MKKEELQKLLDSVVVVAPSTRYYEDPKILPYLFCPKCGCKDYEGSGNNAEHPEHWEYFYCTECDFLVGYIDNSPFRHCLEFKDNNYEIDF